MYCNDACNGIPGLRGVVQVSRIVTDAVAATRVGADHRDVQMAMRDNSACIRDHLHRDMASLPYLVGRRCSTDVL
jgi:hypothetical protein